MLALFGSHSNGSDDLEAMLGRSSETLQRSVVRIPAASDASAGDRFVLGAYKGVRCGALMSGPFLAPGNVHRAGASPSSTTIVAFVGHLAGPVADIDIQIRNPAEVVRIAYGRWGAGCFSRLNGNYSVAIYDPLASSMLVACDAAGSKPVFYSSAGNFVFGSSAMDVLRASGMATVANPRALLRYLTDGTTCGESDTLFEGVHALRGGHYLESVPGRPARVHLIACANRGHEHIPASFAQSAGELQRLLLETVKLQSQGASVGVALSGGIDSSGIAACLRAALGPSAPLPAFSFVHGHPKLPKAWDEWPWAQQAANHVGATLHPVTLQASAIPDALPRIMQRQEFPFSSPVILAQAEVFRVAADNGIQMMLSGHGPDSLFGGGDAHTATRASQLLRRGRIFSAWALLRGTSEYAASTPKRLLLASIRQALPTAWRRANRLPTIPSGVRKAWFLDRVGTREQGEPDFESADPMQRLIFDQVYRSVLPTTLHCEERNAMTQHLENRLPYLVARMLRLAGSLPAEYLISDVGETKRVLRTALTGLVPGTILNRWNRIGFAVPALPWLHELRPWVDERLTELRSLPFRLETPISAVWEQLGGSDSSAWANAYRIWRWITLVEWAKVHDVKFR